MKFIENLSSKKPTIDNGKQIAIEYEPLNKEDIDEYKENTIPAPLGTGLEWALLELGLSRMKLPKYFLYKRKVNIKIKKFIKNILNKEIWLLRKH